MRRITYILFQLMIPFTVFAQDYSFSQYYLDKLSVSPAFVSVGDYSEAGAAVRSQWPGVDGGCRIYMAEYQQKLPGISSGLGARVYGNMEGGAAYSSTGASLIYGYDFQIVYNIKCSLGMEAGFRHSSLSQQKLVYGSMIDRVTGGVSQLNEFIAANGNSSAYLSAGTVLYTKYTMIAAGLSHVAGFAISCNHRPDMQVNVLANHKIVITGNPDKEKQFIVPSVCYAHSRACDMLMPGVYYSGLRLLLSASYRMQWYGGGYCPQAVVTSVGVDLGRVEIAVGHDFETSRVLRQSHGSTEIGIKYKFMNL